LPNRTTVWDATLMRSEAVESRIRAEDIRWRVKQDRWQRHGLSVPAL